MNVHELVGASERTILDALATDLERTVHAYDGLLNTASVVGLLECVKMDLMCDLLKDDEEEAD